MGSGYTAWDGNRYSGEPPAGWYKASDNRWWPSKEIIATTYGYGDNKQRSTKPSNKTPSTQPRPAMPPLSAQPAARRARTPSKPTKQPASTSPPAPAPPQMQGKPVSLPSTLKRISPFLILGAFLLVARVASIDFPSSSQTSASQQSESPTPISQEPNSQFSKRAVTDVPKVTTTIVDTTSTVNQNPPLPDNRPVAANVVLPEPGESITGVTRCPLPDQQNRVTQFETTPPWCLNSSQPYFATIVTSLGDIVLSLDIDSAPIAVNNFVVLAGYNYYDGVAFHNVVSDGWIQTGNASGVSQGPGYDLPEERPTDDGYPIRSVAMSKRAGENNATGSQFFIVTGPKGQSIPADYSVIGKVERGFDVASSIERAEADSTGGPIRPIYITDVEISTIPLEN